MHAEEFELLLKVIIVGESGVGKTQLLHRYVDGTFDESIKNTVGVDIKNSAHNFEGGIAKIHFYDTAGQERFRAVTRSNFQNSDVAIIVYDVTNRLSFERVDIWVELVKENCEPDTQLLLIGNKIDCPSERSVSHQEGAEYAEKQKTFFYEASAKTNESNSVNIAFDTVIDKAIKQAADRQAEIHMKELELIKSKAITIQKISLEKKGCC